MSYELRVEGRTLTTFSEPPTLGLIGRQFVTMPREHLSESDQAEILSFLMLVSATPKITRGISSRSAYSVLMSATINREPLFDYGDIWPSTDRYYARLNLAAPIAIP